MDKKSKIFGAQKILKNFLADKKGQLGVIEFKFWIIGFVIGLIVGIILVALSCKGIIPTVGAICA